jgi:hypothetical protein
MEMVDVKFLPDTLSDEETNVTAQVIWGPWKATRPLGAIVASDVLYTKKNLAVLECTIGKEKLAMKVRYPYGVHERESGKFLEMIESHPHDKRGPASLFPRLYSLIKLSMPNKSVWGGICMKLVGLSVLSLLYPSAIASEDEEENKKALADLSFRFLKRPVWVVDDDAECGGVYVKRVEKRNLQTSLVAACVELLHRFHGFGWVHGDSHLGNFVLDAEKWKIYIIDPERSFQIPKTNPGDYDVVKFLDVQELLGHACGALVTYPHGQSWDFHNVLGVVVKLHPSFRSKKKQADIEALHMLPVCSCFAFETKREKMLGCMCCKSAKNIAVAKRFQKQGLDFVEIFLKTSLKEVRMYVKAARDTCIKECEEMEASLLSCGPDLASYLKKEKYTTLQFDIESIDEDLDEKTNYEVWVRKVLYLGAFFPDWRFKGDKLAAHLRLCGHTKVAHDLMLAMSG